VSLPDSKVIRVQFENAWTLTVAIAMYYQNLCGAWVTAGYFSVKAGKAVVVVRTTNPIWYARTRHRAAHWLLLCGRGGGGHGGLGTSGLAGCRAVVRATPPFLFHLR
jgi:hypothetical protein